MFARVGLLVLGLGGVLFGPCACKRQASDAPAPDVGTPTTTVRDLAGQTSGALNSGGSVTSGGDSSQARGPVTAEPLPTSASGVRERAEVLLASWRIAQNAGSAEDYLMWYEPSEFVGLKRTHSGAIQKFDFAGWGADRKAMFHSRFEIAIENVVVETWLDPGSTLRPGLVKLDFVQRWRSNNYADHGSKRLLVWRVPTTGQWRIVFEEMLLSRPGWSEESARLDAELVQLIGAAKPDQVGAVLSRLNLTMQNAAEVGVHLARSQHPGVFAQAFAELGGLDCLDAIGYSECGDEFEDWGSVENAPLAHACVRRAALIPILQSGHLTATELAALTPRLAEVLASRSSDVPLVEALVEALAKLPQKGPPLDQVVLPFAKALLGPDADNSAATQMFALLSDAAVLALAKDTGRTEVLTHVDARLRADDLYALHFAGVTLPSASLLPVVAKFRTSRKVNELSRLAADDHCDVAMAAAAALAALGNPEFLPRWSRATDAESARRIVCMLRHDEDPVRRDAELIRFIDPKRGVRRIDVTDTVPFGLTEQEILEESAKQMDAAERDLLTRLPALAGMDGVGVFRRATESVNHDLGAVVFLRTNAFDEGVDRPETFGFDVDAAGHAYLDYIGQYRYEDHGCPC